MAIGVSIKAGEGAALKVANNTHKSWWRDPGMRALNWHCFVLLLGSYVCGYDGSVMSGFFSIPSFLSDLGNPDANLQGLATAAISLGYIIGFFPSAWLGDKYGRKWPQFGGAVVVCVGVIMQTWAISLWKFFGARVIIGFGAAFPLTLGSAHLFEIAHPRQGAEMVSLFAAMYWTGAIVAAWVTYGTLYISSDWSWRAPALLQGLGSLIQAAAMYWVPESPRFLAANGKLDEAHRILAKYHANGDMDDPLVLTEMSEITAALAIAREKPAFRYTDFFKTKANLKRLWICIFVGLSVQWAGNGIISYYLIPILSSVGIATSPQQQALNGGLQVWNLAASVVAVIYCQKVSRRALWLGSTAGCLVTYAAFTACSAIFDKNESPAAGRAAVALIYLHSAAYDAAYSIMYYTYVLEVLPYDMRAKGMAVSLVVDYAALFFNQYVNPIGFAAMAWKYYLVYIGMLVIYGFAIYFTFPETANLTLEESAALLDGYPSDTKLDLVGSEEKGDSLKE